MKKNKKLFVGGAVIIVVVIAIAIIAGIYPPAAEEDTSGTIGKVEKFRKQQLTAKDVLLSDDLLKDTVALKNTIGEIGQFTTFSIEMSVLINGYWLPEINANWQTDEGKEVSKNLADFAAFIDNNVEKTAATQNVLYKLYVKKEKTGTEDVGSKLANFVNYVLQLMDRDSVMENTITRLNNYIASNPQVKGNLGKQLKQLQSLRDKIIVDTFLYGTVVGDKKKTDFAGNQILGNKDVMGMVQSEGTAVQMVVIERAAALNIVVYVAYEVGSTAQVGNKIGPGVVITLESASNILGMIHGGGIATGSTALVGIIPVCSAANSFYSYVVNSHSIANKDVAGATYSLGTMYGKNALNLYVESKVSLMSNKSSSIFNKDVLASY